jgi:phosphoribosylformylglycinamidine synthase
VGAKPVAVTDCLNFPNPEKPDNFWVFKTCVQGLADACEAFGTPVISGNVSFYNETPDHAIFPTPTIGMIGVIENPDTRMTMGFKNEGDYIYLIGNGKPQLRGSELSYLLTGEVHGKPPELDIENEIAIQNVVRDLIIVGKVKSAHDATEGGLAVAIAECAITGNIGARIELSTDEIDSQNVLFGERSAAFILSSSEELTIESNGIDIRKIGIVGGKSLEIKIGNNNLSVKVDELTHLYESAIPDLLSGVLPA